MVVVSAGSVVESLGSVVDEPSGTVVLSSGTEVVEPGSVVDVARGSNDVEVVVNTDPVVDVGVVAGIVGTVGSLSGGVSDTTVKDAANPLADQSDGPR
jgi:hypothetical protein